MPTIRQLQPEDDLTDLLALSRAFFREYAAHHPLFEIDALRDEEIVAFFARTLGAADSATFIALEEGRVVGYLACAIHEQAPFYRVKRVGVVSGLMVEATHRRRGIGDALLRRAAAFFRGRGVHYYTLYTAVANDQALAFYRRCGLTPLHINLLGETGADEA